MNIIPTPLRRYLLRLLLPAEPEHKALAPVWLRAERLRMLQLMEGEEPALSCAAVVGRGYFNPSRYQLAIIDGIEYEDYTLFCAMREAASELRERQYHALEQLAALVNSEPQVELEERHSAAIWRDPCAVAGYLDELHWLADGDDD